LPAPDANTGADLCGPLTRHRPFGSLSRQDCPADCGRAPPREHGGANDATLPRSLSAAPISAGTAFLGEILCGLVLDVGRAKCAVDKRLVPAPRSSRWIFHWVADASGVRWLSMAGRSEV